MNVATHGILQAKMAEANIDQIIAQFENQSLLQQAPYGYPTPKEIATYSTRLRSEGEDPVRTNQDCTSDESMREYSVIEDYNRALCDSSSANLMELYKPALERPNFDLTRGYGTQIEKNRQHEHISMLLECLADKDYVGKSDFVFKRRGLASIAAIPLQLKSKGKDFKVQVVIQKVNNVCYCYCPNLDQQITTEDEKRNAYQGRKFESYLVAEKGQEPDAYAPMDFNKEFCSVVYTKLGDNSLILAGEVDCCLPGDPKHYVQLKTRMNKQTFFYREKLLQWWLQSFLIGANDIRCGLRNLPDGAVVRQIEPYNVSNLPNLIKKEEKRLKHGLKVKGLETWNVKECIDYLKSFLDRAREEVTEELVPHVYTRLPGERNFKMTKDLDGNSKFLPLWFTEMQLTSK